MPSTPPPIEESREDAFKRLTVDDVTDTQMIVIREKKRWPQAEIVCKSYGGHLASVKSDQENEALIALANTNEPVWIGGNDLLEDGNWKWADGSKMDYKEADGGNW